jgi:hypothetical protein
LDHERIAEPIQVWSFFDQFFYQQGDSKVSSRLFDLSLFYQLFSIILSFFRYPLFHHTGHLLFRRLFLLDPITTSPKNKNDHKNRFIDFLFLYWKLWDLDGALGFYLRQKNN